MSNNNEGKDKSKNDLLNNIIYSINNLQREYEKEIENKMQKFANDGNYSDDSLDDDLDASQIQQPNNNNDFSDSSDYGIANLFCENKVDGDVSKDHPEINVAIASDMNNNNIAIYECPNCLFLFNDFIALNDHILIVHDNVFEEQIYSCDICGQEYNSQLELTDHLRVHVAKRRIAIKMPDILAPEQQKVKRKGSISASSGSESGSISGSDGAFIDIPDFSKSVEQIIRSPIFHGKSEASRKRNIISESESDSDDDDLEIDNIPTNPRGRHQCSFCRRRYLTEHMLGSHFMIAHGRYDGMLQLDNDTQRIGFPGYDILIAINMINEPLKKDLEKLLIKKTECNICRENYRAPEQQYKPSEFKMDYDYDSDTEVNYGSPVPRPQLAKTYSWDDMSIGLNTREVDYAQVVHNYVREPELVAVINKFIAISRMPIQMACCQNLLCTKCLEELLANSHNLVCPYCFKDHTQYDKQFIVFHEVGKTNKKAWTDWWLRGDKYINILTT